jgi:endonuclease YncB( thermonuclease family)
MDSPRSRLFLLFVLLLLLSVSSSPSAASVLAGIVVNIADGDTIAVLDSEKVQHRVRIARIDAPEGGYLRKRSSLRRQGRAGTMW